MIFERFSLIARAIPDRREARRVAERWVQADQAVPELKEDLIRLGGVMAAAPERFENGAPALDPVDPYRLAVLEGRRQLALELLAMMNLSAWELAQMMGDNREPD